MESKAESGTPCKLTKFSVHTTEENVISVKAAKQINDALEPTPVVTTKDHDDIQVYQTITVRGMVLFGENKAQPFPTKTDLIKRERSFVDEVGNIPITIWNEHIKSTFIRSKTFVFDNLKAKNTYSQRQTQSLRN